ncbi:hypothetical protein T492DRAFT_998909 [Pavlovales sp. CCMP2436]|nr:hypothetical protein T492DRAFT_998909 [Pavlovales sp. CCMP2436]
MTAMSPGLAGPPSTSQHSGGTVLDDAFGAFWPSACRRGRHDMRVASTAARHRGGAGRPLLRLQNDKAVVEPPTCSRDTRSRFVPAMAGRKLPNACSSELRAADALVFALRSVTPLSRGHQPSACHRHPLQRRQGLRPRVAARARAQGKCLPG